MITFREALQQLNVQNAHIAPEHWPPTLGGVVGWLVDLGYQDNLISWGRAIESLRPALDSSFQPALQPTGTPLVMAPQQMRQMQDALLAAFRPGDMDTLCMFGIGTPWDEIVAPGGFRDQVFQLIRWLISKDKVIEFVTLARKENPGNLLLKSFAESIGVRELY